jgi:hypothetical protein
MALTFDVENLCNLFCILQRTTKAHDDYAHQEDDVVTIVQERGYVPLNLVFDYEAFEFNCIIGPHDISIPFNEYYDEAISAPYDQEAFPDFL